MDTIDIFIRKLREELDDIEDQEFNPETSFRDIEDWSSMHVLILIAFIDTEYDIEVNAEEFSNLSTINDVYELINSKQ